jgi:serine/threonine protein kinase
MSNFPSLSDIVYAFENIDSCINTELLKGGKPFFVNSRIELYTGGFSTVIPFLNQFGEKIAVKCWIADVGNSKLRCQEISKKLKSLNSEYFVDFEYIENAILINNNLEPVLVMDWSDKILLKDFIEYNINNKSVLLQLAESFKKLFHYLHSENISHGDLQHENILVGESGQIVLIDYDSMYVDTLEGQKDIVKGLPGYQHPKRNQLEKISSKTDYFSELVIYTSIIVLSYKPEYWHEIKDSMNFIFSKNDFLDPQNSKIFNDLDSFNNNEITNLVNIIKYYLSIDDIDKLVPFYEINDKNFENIVNKIISKFETPPEIIENVNLDIFKKNTINDSKNIDSIKSKF